MKYMKTKILFFGQLIDITGTKELTIDEVADTDALTIILHQQFPQLSQSKYLIAVDQEVISGRKNLEDNCIVALMPPFSGG